MFDSFKRKNTNNLECNGDDLMLPSSRVDVLISKNPPKKKKKKKKEKKEKIPLVKVDELTSSVVPLP